MNKQEAIETIEQDKIQVGRFVEINREVNAIQRKIEMVDYVPLETVVSMIDKINESQKVVVPKFVADRIDWCKRNRLDFKDLFSYLECGGELDDWAHDENGAFISEKADTLARAWLAYPNITVKKKKLYTVEIEGVSSGKLFKNIRTNKYLFHSGKKLKGCTDRLTETEIKQKDKRLWQFAKEVEGWIGRY